MRALGLAVAVSGLALASCRSISQVVRAFSLDGFDVAANISRPSGAFAVKALSRNVTLRSTGERKAAFFVFSEDAFERGVLVGTIASAEVEEMAVHYINHFIPALLSAKLDMIASGDPLYDELCVLIGEAVTDLVNKSFFGGGNSRLIPPQLVDEMRGVVEGARLSGLSNVSMARIVTLNYGMDFLSAHAYAGSLSGVIRDHRRIRGAASRRARAWLDALTEADVSVPAFCDAFVAHHTAVRSGSGAVFARGFQLPAAGAFERANAPMVVVGSPDQQPFVGAAAPGMVGLITGLNAAGVAIGVDTLRTGDVNVSFPGHASILMVRAVAEGAASLDEAVDYVVSRHRGLSWLFPLADPSSAAILETGKWRPEAAEPDLSGLVQDASVRALLANFSWLQDHIPSPYRGAGVWARNASYSVPESFVLDHNKPFFELAQQPWPGADAFAPGGAIFANFTAEDDSWGRLASRYYSPSRHTASQVDTLVVSNLAQVPQLRAAEMTGWASAIPGHAAQTRFDTLSHLVQAASASIDAEVGKRLISFLQPCPSASPLPAGWISVPELVARPGPIDPAIVLNNNLCTPGFWTDVIDPSDPRSAVVEGQLAVADLQTKTLHVKAGYWSDGWLHITLPAYL